MCIHVHMYMCVCACTCALYIGHTYVYMYIRYIRVCIHVYLSIIFYITIYLAWLRGWTLAWLEAWQGLILATCESQAPVVSGQLSKVDPSPPSTQVVGPSGLQHLNAAWLLLKVRLSHRWLLACGF